MHKFFIVITSVVHLIENSKVNEYKTIRLNIQRSLIFIKNLKLKKSHMTQFYSW
jgi:hypothetical protein